MAGWAASAALVLMGVGAMVWIAFKPKPDPKMRLLLALLEDLPHDAAATESVAEDSEDADPRKEHDAMGPSGFSHLA